MAATKRRREVEQRYNAVLKEIQSRRNLSYEMIAYGFMRFIAKINVMKPMAISPTQKKGISDKTASNYEGSTNELDEIRG